MTSQSRFPLLAAAVLAATVSVSRLTGQTAQVQAADLVLRGGRIVTLDDRTPEAQALAARGDTIVALGSDAAIARYVGPSTQVIDLAGQLAIPGFIEGHGHFTGIGNNRINLDLMGTKSWDDILRLLAPGEVDAEAGSER
jgi:predicted amidohydrolase YtcJ